MMAKAVKKTIINSLSYIDKQFFILQNVFFQNITAISGFLHPKNSKAIKR